MTAFFSIAGYLALINLATLGAFSWDKAQARRDGRRISENALLNLSFVGGSPAAKYAQRRFRHKTRKRPFTTQLNAIVVFHVVAGIAAIVFWARGGSLADVVEIGRSLLG